MDYRIPVHAPTGRFYLQFKHLHGTIIKATNYEPLYVSGTNQYTKEQVMNLLLYSTEPLPHSMLGGHRLATASYLWYWHDGPQEYDAGVAVINEVGEVSKSVLRGRVLPYAIDHLLKADRAYFHLHLSKLEGRDMAPLISTALAGERLPTHRTILLAHLLRQAEYQDYHNMITQILGKI